MRPETGSKGRRLISCSEEIHISQETIWVLTSQLHHTLFGKVNDSPLPILDTTDQDRIPNRVQLTSPSVHHVAEVLVDLLGR